MTKFGQDFILALGLVIMTAICLFLIVYPGVHPIVKILAGIAIFDIAVVAFLLLKNW